MWFEVVWLHFKNQLQDKNQFDKEQQKSETPLTWSRRKLGEGRKNYLILEIYDKNIYFP